MRYDSVALGIFSVCLTGFIFRVCVFAELLKLYDI